MEKAPKGKCDSCPLSGAIFVPSELHDKSKVLFLAEAPGYHEAQDGKPLVGVAGQDFNQIVKDCGASRDDGNYMNAVTCRPTKVIDGKTYNRTPTDVEIRCCNDRLYYEVEALSPVIIVCMGKIPYVALGGNAKAAMKDIVGTRFTWKQKYSVLVTYHPAAIAHSGGAGTERGKMIRDKIAEAVKDALSVKHIDKQLRLIDAPIVFNKSLQPIIIEMEKMKRNCNQWWHDQNKCDKCKQKFYCFGGGEHG